MVYIQLFNGREDLIIIDRATLVKDDPHNIVSPIFIRLICILTM